MTIESPPARSIAYRSDAKWNETDGKRPAFDKIPMEARTVADEAKRKALYGELRRMISDDGGAVIPMVIDHLEVGAKKMKGMGPNSLCDLMGQRIGEKIWIES